MATLAQIHADQLQPFTLENAAVRGRIVRLGSVVDTILTRHAYPDAVSRLLGEVLCVASILAANLKQEGIITIQMKGNGPIRMLIVDAAAEQNAPDTGQLSGCALRGYAELNEEKPITNDHSPRGLLGEDSYLAITYDPGRGMQRYQGVVTLEGQTLADALSSYFTQSQQLDINVKLATSRGDAGWVAGGLMIERIAGEGGTEPHTETQEAWRTALAYVGTVQANELLDIELPLQELLFRLFHETGARVTDPITLTAHCRCSRPRIHAILMSMPAEDRADMVEGGSVSVHCQFCNSTERFTPEELELAFNQ